MYTLLRSLCISGVRCFFGVALVVAVRFFYRKPPNALYSLGITVKVCSLGFRSSLAQKPISVKQLKQMQHKTRLAVHSSHAFRVQLESGLASPEPGSVQKFTISSRKKEAAPPGASSSPKGLSTWSATWGPAFCFGGSAPGFRTWAPQVQGQ